jgi:hypothetical protein
VQGNIKTLIAERQYIRLAAICAGQTASRAQLVRLNRSSSAAVMTQHRHANALRATTVTSALMR